VIRALQIFREAANKARVAGPTLQGSAPEIPWDVMYGMRNRIVHDYFEVDMDVVWQTIQRDLAVLRPRRDMATNGLGLSQSIGKLRRQAAHSDEHRDGKFLALSQEVQRWRRLTFLVNN
jgi:hypothetical protein